MLAKHQVREREVINILDGKKLGFKRFKLIPRREGVALVYRRQAVSVASGPNRGVFPGGKLRKSVPM